MPSLNRTDIFPEMELPDSQRLMDDARRLAQEVSVGSCSFLAHYDVASESEYKRQCMAQNRIMLHAQVGYRSLDKSRRAYFEIYANLERAGYRVDRYGICLDWSMGYPAASRKDMPRGTGLILDSAKDFARLTQEAPVAPHFGDFVIGTPASVENTCAALMAGSTSIGNLGQYFTFRMPYWKDDIGVTAETVKAIALCAAQPVEILIHSNLDDGFASLFTDMACSIGAILLERTIVDELIGGRVSHCYGHTFSEAHTRLAFQRAMAKVTATPGSMVYGNTTIYGEGQVENYANLASYQLVDVLAQRLMPTGHGLNPVPVSEAMRIPEIDEIVEAHLFANRLIQRATSYESLLDLEKVDEIAEKLVEGGRKFYKNVLEGLAAAGIDTNSAFELLLAIRRIGARRLEELFGPGEQVQNQARGRAPLIQATTMASLAAQADQILNHFQAAEIDVLQKAGFRACVACTDVHEYGKMLVEIVLRRLGIGIVDAGVSVDPDVVANQAYVHRVDFIAISTYSGVALDYLQVLCDELTERGYPAPVFIGGKLNQVPDESLSSMPVDVSTKLQELGAYVCHRVETMIEVLILMADRKVD